MVTVVCSFAPAPTVRMAAGGPYVGSGGTAIGENAYGEAIPIWGNKWVRMDCKCYSNGWWHQMHVTVELSKSVLTMHGAWVSCHNYCHRRSASSRF